MSESSFRRTLAQSIRTLDPRAWVQQVETGGTGAGVPDTYVCTQGRSLWLELKVASVPKTERGRIRCRHLKPEQLVWMARLWQAGGRAWVALRYGRRYCILHPEPAERLLLPGCRPEDLREAAEAEGADTLALARWVVDKEHLQR